MLRSVSLNNNTFHHALDLRVCDSNNANFIFSSCLDRINGYGKYLFFPPSSYYSSTGLKVVIVQPILK